MRLASRTLRWPRRVAWLGAWLLGFLALGFLLLFAAANEPAGREPDRAALARMQQSPHWRAGRFVNVLPRVDGPWFEMTRLWFTGGSEHRTPKAPVDLLPRRGTSFTAPAPGGLSVTWFGHSSLLIDIDGHRVLIDPVWGERISPFSFMGPARFFAPPLPLSELPALDAVVISHDHYDHLDMPTVKALAGRDMRWVVPLGVGAHLLYWGVPAARITELDWWETTRVRGLTLTATPARHFSGRSIIFNDINRSLWSGWAMTTNARRIYYSGDTAMFDELIEIGQRLGPFDLTLIEVGAYNRLWCDVHLGPEQAVRAHRLVRGKLMLPVHWGLFDLALHAWTEPIERVLVAADKENVQVVSPRPGETVNVDAPPAIARWWPRLPYESVQEHDARSTGVEHLLGPQLPSALQGDAGSARAAPPDAAAHVSTPTATPP